MIRFNTRAQEPDILRIEPFRGMDIGVTATQIDRSQSAEMLNMNIDEKGALNKRTGYTKAFQNSLGPGPINQMLEYKGQLIFTHGTTVYSYNGTGQPKSIAGISKPEVALFVMNEELYIIDGEELQGYNGSSSYSLYPYIPTITISNTPLGGGTLYEDWNLLSSRFKESYSGDGTSLTYKLHTNRIDRDEPMRVWVDGSEKDEGTDFTVSYLLGEVRFAEGRAPSKGTNNVVIEAKKEQVDFPERILNCTISTVYGGSNDTRVFLSGNPDFPQYMWRSGVYEPSYFPENGFYKFNDKIVGFAKQYDTLIVERESGKTQVSFELDSDGYPTFASKPLNDTIGTYAKKSIQIVENNPVSLNKNGVYMLTSSNVRDERNVSHISSNIDPRLLSEQNLQDAVSVDYDKKYWLAVNSKVYVLDYSQASELSPFGEWYIYDNIPASAFLEYNGHLYFGSSQEGMLYSFMKETDFEPYNDNGQPIRAMWKSKQFTFDMTERRKMVPKVFYSLKPMRRTSAELSFQSNKKNSKLLKTIRTSLFDFRDVNFNNFTFYVSAFPEQRAAKIKAKKITHFQLIIENNQLNEGMGVLSLGIKYKFQSEVK